MHLIRFILIGILIYLILKTVRIFVSGFRSASAKSKQPKKGEKTMVHDEVCDTYIPKDEALRVLKDGKEYFFCSEECRQLFLEGKTKKTTNLKK